MTVPIADVVVIKDNAVLLVQQRKSSAYGLWSLPGGHVEPGESIEQAVRREAMEEIGVRLLNIKHVYDYTIEFPDKQLIVHTFSADIRSTIVLNDTELMAYGWFSPEALQQMSPLLRNKNIIPAVKAATGRLTNQ